jgi:acetate kinase
MGVELDYAANASAVSADCDISAPGAPVRILLVHAREEIEIASQCERLLPP